MIEARLSTATGSLISRVGDQVEATIIARVCSDGQTVIPQGSNLLGSIESLERFGFGLRQVTAKIHYQFDTIRFLNGETMPIGTELIEVETAKERVDIDGTVRGIHPAVSVSSSLALVTVPLLFVAPAVGAPVWGVKSMVAPAASPEIYFPVGTEFLLRLTTPLAVRSVPKQPVEITSFSSDELSQIRHLLNGSAQRARLGTRPSDFVNLLFLGSREQLDRAFGAAGWSRAERKSPLSLYRMYHALTRRIGYRRAPMNTLTLNGLPADFVYQKNLDTVQKRHHVRVWRDAHRQNVWLGAAAQDIGFRFELTHWTHSTDPKIDNERAKVVNDLAFTGCLDAAATIPHDSSDVRQRREDDRRILTDSQLAMVQLNGCEHPINMPGANAAPGANTQSGLSHSLALLRNDLRLNVFFTTYNTLKLLSERKTLRPLRKIPSSDVESPGLDWLSSLPTRPQSRFDQHPAEAAARQMK